MLLNVINELLKDYNEKENEKIEKIFKKNYNRKWIIMN